jgi:hypothetical protein
VPAENFAGGLESEGARISCGSVFVAVAVVPSLADDAVGEADGKAVGDFSEELSGNAMLTGRDAEGFAGCLPPSPADPAIDSRLMVSGTPESAIRFPGAASMGAAICKGTARFCCASTNCVVSWSHEFVALTLLALLSGRLLPDMSLPSE